MPKKRAQITRQTADQMYEDVIDRVTAPVNPETAVITTPTKKKKAGAPLLKVTVYMTPDDVLAVDYLVSHEFRTTGRRPRRSEIICRAIRALHQQTLNAE